MLLTPPIHFMVYIILLGYVFTKKYILENPSKGKKFPYMFICRAERRGDRNNRYTGASGRVGSGNSKFKSRDKVSKKDENK